MIQSRFDRVLQEMERSGIPQLLVSDPLGILYLTGIENHPFERFWALLLRRDGRHVLFSNKLFNLPATPLEVVTLSDTDDVAAHVAPHLLPGVMGVDKTLQARFLLPILSAAPAVKPVLGSDCVDNVRACKDETERRLMRRASEINDACIQKVAAFIHDGVTERECAQYLDRCYAEYGCEGLAFDSIISFGANAADPHHTPDDTVVREGDCIVIDIGCVKDRYCSDMTRTYFWKKADPKYVKLYETVREANEKAIAMIRPGVPLCELDAAARDHIAAAGYGAYFTHRLGHFIGMEDHEKGDVSSANTAPACVNQVFSIEPGIYLPGEFGCRVEDLVIVTEDGCEVINHVDKGLTILGC
ncbi:MAG: M24 family metallopeptidase [Oscillospiraceae bacterium]